MTVRTVLKRATAAGLASAVLAVPVLAHHSYGMFDRREVKLQGTVKEFQWANPHVFVQVVVPGAAGQADEWSLEATGPGGLAREGWTFNSLKVGDKVTFGVAPLRDGRKGGGLIFIAKADGKKLWGGPLSSLDPEFKRERPTE